MRTIALFISTLVALALLAGCGAPDRATSSRPTVEATEPALPTTPLPTAVIAAPASQPTIAPPEPTAASDGQTNAIEIPAEGARVALPLHLLARLGQPGDQVTAVVRWQNGIELADTFTLLQSEDERGLLIGNLDWKTESEPPQPTDRSATLELRDRAGAILAQRHLEVLRWDDPETQEVQLFWILGEELQQATRRVPRTPRIGTAALEELIWGPRPGDLAGFETAIPTPQDVLRYPGRAADWGPRVRLLGLAIEGGVATANFSPELKAYGGGALQVRLIREQITRTLKQFPSVREVRIAVAGQIEGALEP